MTRNFNFCPNCRNTLLPGKKCSTCQVMKASFGKGTCEICGSKGRPVRDEESVIYLCFDHYCERKKIGAEKRVVDYWQHLLKKSTLDSQRAYYEMRIEAVKEAARIVRSRYENE